MQDAKRPNTKTQLLCAAERLFAEKGLGAVSVREITRAAGARNESALHYHFGGMDALIREGFIARYHVIEQARLDRLAELDAAGRRHDLFALMEATVGPLFENCSDEHGRLYARFCVQLTTAPYVDIAEIIRETGMASVQGVRDRVLECLPDLSPDLVTVRLRRLLPISMILAADHARQIELGQAPSAEAATREAAAALSAFLAARVPEDTP